MVGLARFHLKKNTLVVILLILVSVMLMRFTSMDRPALSTPEVLLRDLLAPLQSGVIAVSRGISTFTGSITSYQELMKQNRELQRQVGELTAANNRLQGYGLENMRLRKMLGFKETASQQWQLVPATVIGRDPGNWYRTLTINRGKLDGIAKNMPVINHQGLIGRIANVSQHTAEVLLILDREGAVGALVQSTRVPGVVEGVADGSGRLQMIHLPHDAPVRENQTVITSGLGVIFPKGLRIGYISQVLPSANGLVKKAIVEPFVDFDRIEEVMVITGVREQAGGPAASMQGGN